MPSHPTVRVVVESRSAVLVVAFPSPGTHALAYKSSTCRNANVLCREQSATVTPVEIVQGAVCSQSQSLLLASSGQFGERSTM